MTTRRRYTLLPGIVFLISAGLLNCPPALATASTDRSAETSLQIQVDAALKARPGGMQIAPDQVSWENGAVVLTVASPLAPRAVGSCATGAFCAYSGTHLTGSKMSFTTCTTHSTAGITVRSIANARNAGSVKAKNTAGSVLATVGAGSSLATAPANVAKLSCG